MFKIYKSQFNPSTLSGQVGGNIGSATLSGYVGELFATVTAPPSGVASGAFQYRKVFVKNEYSTSTTSTKAWIDSIEHPEQISLALSTSLSDSSSNPAIAPAGVTGWVAADSFSSGLLLGTLAPNAYTGFWIRQVLSGINTPDPYATFRLYVGGVV